MKKNWILFLLLLFVVPFIILAQRNDLPADISRVKIEDLTENQIQELVIRLEKTGMTESDLEQMALMRGMQPSQISALRKRISEYRMKSSSYEGQEKLRGRIRTYAGDPDSVIFGQKRTGRIEKAEEPGVTDFFDFLYREEELPEITLEDQIFGLNLFRSDKITFEPTLNIPTPVDYQLGQGDELIIDIWGVSEMTYIQLISPEGTVIIPGIGPVFLSGLTINESSAKLKKELSKIYSGLSGTNPNTFLNVSLGNVRSIKVNLAGEVFVPGTYTLPSLATVYNALYFAGGPTINGSLRNIKVIRNNKIISVIDLYRFLLDGISEGNVRLEDQDVIFIEPYENRVEIEGEIKRPGYYEMNTEETLSDLIKFTGGFTGKAYTRQVKTIRKTDTENKIINVLNEDFNKITLHNGDKITIDSVLNKFENRVEIAGAVFRPGEYSLEEEMTLHRLIDIADGLREDAFPNRGVIYRHKEDLTLEVIPFNKFDITNETSPILLKKEDLVVIPSIFDLREELTVEITGEIKKPGKYPFVINSSIEDLIIQAGGLLESASFSVLEVARRVKNPDALQSANRIADIYQFPINHGLTINQDAASFKLEPFDIVFVRRSPGYETQKLMRIEGEVHFPGAYSLYEKNERISSIIQRAGGLTQNAYEPGARLIRKISAVEAAKKQLVKELAVMAGDTLVMEKERKSEHAIGIDLEKILANPGSSYDIFVQEGDRLIIPKQLQTVSIDGAVLYSTTVRYDDKFHFTKYIENAGGFTENARKRNTYIIYPNGAVNKTSSFLFINDYPRVEPGSEIYVPVKEEKRKLSPAETIGIFSATASMSLVIVTLINALK